MKLMPTIHIKIGMIIFFSFFVSILFPQKTATEWEDLGFRKQDSSLLKESIDAFTRAIELKPTEFAYGGRARSYEFLKDYENALKDYDKALTFSSPNHIYLLSRRGLVHGYLGNDLLALKDFNAGLQIDSNSTELLLNKAIVLYTQLGRPYEASMLFEKVIRLDSINGLAYYYQGSFFMEHLQEYKRAITSYTKSIKLETITKNVAYSYCMRGYSKSMVNDFSGAIEDISMAIELDPTPVVYNGRGLVYTEMDSNQKAFDDFSAAIDLDSTFSDGYLNRGVVKFYINQNGCDDLKKARELGHPKAQPAMDELCR